MSRFSNPEPIDFTIPEGVQPTDINPLTGESVEQVEQVTQIQDEEQLNPVDVNNPPVDLSDEIVPTEPIESADQNYETNPYLTTINNLVDKGIIVEPYEGFTEDTEPTQEVLLNFLEHNLEIRDRKVIEDFIGDISPLAQRILEYDLNSKGQNTESYLRTLIEENNIKSLNVENEYDQEKIMRLWLKDEDWTSDEIEEKIQDLKNSSLLQKEANRVKPKLDARAEAIAKEEEEAQRMLRQIETKRKEDFFNRVESIIKTGKVDNLTIGREDAEKIMSLLLVDDVPVRLPEGKELRMNYLEAEIFKHKYSSKGNPNLLIQVAYLLSNPEKFYKQFANAVQTKEVNEFVKSQKYNIQSKSAPIVEKEKKDKRPANVPWNKSW